MILCFSPRQQNDSNSHFGVRALCLLVWMLGGVDLDECWRTRCCVCDTGCGEIPLTPRSPASEGRGAGFSLRSGRPWGILALPGAVGEPSGGELGSLPGAAGTARAEGLGTEPGWLRAPQGLTGLTGRRGEGLVCGFVRTLPLCSVNDWPQLSAVSSLPTVSGAAVPCRAVCRLPGSPSATPRCSVEVLRAASAVMSCPWWDMVSWGWCLMLAAALLRSVPPPRLCNGITVWFFLL